MQTFLKASCQFYNPGMFSLRTQEPSLWNRITEEDTAPTFQSLLEWKLNFKEHLQVMKPLPVMMGESLFFIWANQTQMTQTFPNPSSWKLSYPVIEWTWAYAEFCPLSIIAIAVNKVFAACLTFSRRVCALIVLILILSCVGQTCLLLVFLLFFNLVPGTQPDFLRSHDN